MSESSKRHDLPQTSKTFSDFLNGFKEDFLRLNRSSAEYWEHVHADLANRWGQWPEYWSEFKSVVGRLPLQLRQSETIMGLICEMENFDHNARHFFNRLQVWQGEGLGDVPAQGGYVMQYHMIKLRDQLGELSQSLGNISAHPVYLSLVRGDQDYPERHHLQWGRKIFHMGNALVFLYLYYFAGLSREFLVNFGLAFTLLTVAIEVTRQHYTRLNHYICRFFGPLMRSYEIKGVTSAIFFIVAMYLVYVAFPIEVAILSLLFVGVGDPVAGVVGTRWGKTILKPGVSLEGFLACFGVCTILTAVFSAFILDEIALHGFMLVIFSLACGFIAAMAESSFKKFDDNLVIPLFSAPLVYMLLMILQ